MYYELVEVYFFHINLKSHESNVQHYQIIKQYSFSGFLQALWLPPNIELIAMYGILFCSEIFFPTTQELEYLFSPQNLTLGQMTKTLNQIFFFLHQNQNIFFSNIGNQNIFFQKETITLEVKWSVPQITENKIFEISKITKIAIIPLFGRIKQNNFAGCFVSI